jgi:uncharacterized protein YbgA (DUF1722 family)
MPAMRRSLYTELLKSLKVLRYYVPDKLFAESNLPQVRVFLSPIQNGCEVNGRTNYRIKLVSEDASLVFSSAGYLPGKPTYRTRHSVIIPLNNDNIFIEHKDLVTKIDNYYQGKVKSLSSMISLPDELVYVADYMLGAKQVRLYFDVDSIHVIRLTNVIRLMYNVVECYNCVFLPRDTKAHIPARRLSGGVDYFHVYLPSSNSYSRHFIYLESSSYNPIDEFEINDLGELRIFDNVFVHNLVYAIDVDARIRGPYCSPNVQQCKTVRAQYQHFCVVLPRSIERNKTQAPKKIKTRKLQFVKVFIDDKERSKATPVAIGYRISNTFLLKFDTKGKFNEAMLAICQSVGQDVKDRMTPSRLYKKLTVNTAIINFVKHILSYDLVSSYYFSKLKLVRIDQFIKYIFLVNDILSQGLTATITAQPDVSNVVNKIFESLRSGLDNLRTDKVQMLRYLVFTTRDGELGFFTDDKEPEDEVREYGLNEIRKRLHNVLESQKQISKKIINKEDWRYGVLLDFIRHTYGHHLIKIISQSANVDSTKLIEGYVERKWEPVLVIERDRGGLGILQGALDEYKRDTYRAYRDLILSFGKCLVGTPEDVLHFILAEPNFRKRLCEAEPRELARVIEEFVRDRMELLLLPEELIETVRLWHSIRMEAQRFVELLPQEKLRNAIRPDCALLQEIHEGRFQLEKTIYRFPELDELIVFLLLNMQKGQVLRSIVEELLERSLRVADRSSKLRQIYDNKDNYIELFLEDVKNILKNGCETRGTVPRICASKRKGKYPPEVVYAVRALGRIMRGILLRLALLTCNSACGHCYVNTRSCSRFSAPFIQARTLDRRLAKIVASGFVKLKFDVIQDLYNPSFEPDIVARLKKGDYSKVNLELL